MEKIKVLRQVDKPVSRSEFGAKWPFTVDHGILRAVRFNALAGSSEIGHLIAVLFEASDGVVYAINGMADSWAKEFGWEDVHPIWAAGDGFPKKDISPIIDAGRKLAGGMEGTGLNITPTTLN